MNKGNLFIMILLALVFAVNGWWFVRFIHVEPVYQNRRLGVWLQDFDDTSHPEKQALAAEALRHIGSSSVPFLIAQLSETKNQKFQVELNEWRKKGDFDVPRPHSPRYEALAGLDALGPDADSALPELAQMLQESPLNPAVMYVVARMGQDGVPVLTSQLSSRTQFNRMEAQVCLEMISSHSEVLYPRNTTERANSFNRRLIELNMKLMHSAYLNYKAWR